MDLTIYIIPALVVSLLIYAAIKKVNAYDSFIKGAKEGALYSFEILPYVASMIIATAVFKSSDFLLTVVRLLHLGYVNVDLITLLFFKPISGMASLSVVTEIFKTYGPDSFAGYFASLVQGSTDTTLYIITVYFGAVGIKNIRYALKAGLLIDLISFIICFLIVTFLIF